MSVQPYQSTDERIIAQAVRDHDSGLPITHLQAKVIANAWHGGQSSDLYALASSGAIREDFNMGLRAGCETHPEIQALHTYVSLHGTRGPQDGWDALTW